MRCWHITFATDDRLPLFDEAGGELRCIRVVGRIARGRLVLFILVDDHLHLVIVCAPEEVGRIRRAFWQGIAPIVTRPLAPPRTRVIHGRSHLRNTLPYLLKQTDRHGIDVHPASWAGSCFHDLVGARVIPGLDLAFFRLLPRLGVGDVFEAAGLPHVLPADAEAVRTAGACRLVGAAFGALGCVPGATSPRWLVASARGSAASLGTRAGMSTAELAWALDVTPRHVRRLAARPVELGPQRATLLQLAIEDAVREQRLGQRSARRA